MASQTMFNFQESPMYRLLFNVRTADEVYNAAVYGALYNETQILHMLKTLGLKRSSQILEKEKYKESLKILNVLAQNNKKTVLIQPDKESSWIQDAKKPTLKLSKKHLSLLKEAIRDQLKVVQDVPQLARQQVIITYSSFFEGFVSDTITDFFRAQPQSLKSERTTFKDSQLIDSIIEGNTLSKLIEIRVREIMSDSITGWITYLRKKGLDVAENNDLKEMFLVRNVLVHNNKKASPELVKAVTKRKYVLGKEVEISVADMKRFGVAVKKVATEICTEYVKKVVKKNVLINIVT